MHTFYRYAKQALINIYYWFLDYVYVVFWEVAGFMRPVSPSIYSRRNKNQPSLVLIPGVYENWQFMKPVADMLFKRGYNVHIVEALGYNRGSVEEMADVVQGYIAEQGLKNCTIIAHSKGGLIGKYLLLRSDADSIKGLITLNTPFLGSKYAHLLPFKHLRIFIPNSVLLSMLAKSQSINKKVVSIYGIFDPHIPDGSYLEGAQNIRLPVRGHFQIIKNTLVHEEIISSIRRLHKM